jgi:hypothetical protein
VWRKVELCPWIGRWRRRSHVVAVVWLGGGGGTARQGIDALDCGDGGSNHGDDSGRLLLALHAAGLALPPLPSTTSPAAAPCYFFCVCVISGGGRWSQGQSCHFKKILASFDPDIIKYCLRCPIANYIIFIVSISRVSFFSVSQLVTRFLSVL